MNGATVHFPVNPASRLILQVGSETSGRLFSENSYCFDIIDAATAPGDHGTETEYVMPPAASILRTKGLC